MRGDPRGRPQGRSEDRAAPAKGNPAVRGRISAAALELFLRSGFARTGVREIAAAAQVSVGSVFNYFSCKEEILYDLISEMQHKVAPMIQAAADECRDQIGDPNQSVEAALVKLIRQYAGAVDTWQHHIVVGYQESRWLPRDRLREITLIERRMRDSLAEILLAGVKRGEFTPGDLKFRANVIQTLLQAWATRRWALEDMDLEEFLSGVERVLLAALHAPQAAR